MYSFNYVQFLSLSKIPNENKEDEETFSWQGDIPGGKTTIVFERKQDVLTG